ncbi:hypothetical protein FGO68_gene15591 [Halteria grandinella]|uniref:RING-type domain-containing protein n=1 Tax=Halteria grandinella TaxID=5974 RepID=A0A8J8NL15_HALGN|nr:hypothetical protein FGO68_gene15591 [Halteria grandinella]
MCFLKSIQEIFALNQSVIYLYQIEESNLEYIQFRNNSMEASNPIPPQSILQQLAENLEQLSLDSASEDLKPITFLQKLLASQYLSQDQELPNPVIEEELSIGQVDFQPIDFREREREIHRRMEEMMERLHDEHRSHRELMMEHEMHSFMRFGGEDSFRRHRMRMRFMGESDEEEEDEKNERSEIDREELMEQLQRYDSEMRDYFRQKDQYNHRMMQYQVEQLDHERIKQRLREEKGNNAGMKAELMSKLLHQPTKTQPIEPIRPARPEFTQMMRPSMRFFQDPLAWVERCTKISKYVKVGDEEVACAICYRDFQEGEDASTLVCKHQFHPDCIKQWFKHKAICPTCRASAKY